MEFKRTLDRKSYSIEIPMDEFTAITEYEWESGYESTLSELLNKHANVYDTDYNGHFGNRIYFTMDANDDTPETWELIFQYTTDFIEMSTNWLKEFNEQGAE